MLPAKMQLPSMFGWTPSVEKNDCPFHNRLKLSIKPMFLWAQADLSEVDRARILLKCSTPRFSVGIGPEIKTNRNPDTY